MTSPASSNDAAASLSILIVDDNADAADSLGMLLEFEGHKVTVALSGAQALELGPQLQPAAAFIDIGMPGMDGYELARQIRQQAWGSAMLLVASTGWGGEDDKRRALEAGFNRHITKPAEIETLLAAIADWQSGRTG